MPREWYDWHKASEIQDPDMRRFYMSILANKKPYFMRYIYPDLMKEYKNYIKAVEKKARRDFKKSIGELLSQPSDSLSETEREFLHYHERCMPVGDGNCVVNRICRRFEAEFDGYIGKHIVDKDFDYRIMKSDASYTKRQYDAVSSLFEDFCKRTKDFMARASRERVSEEEKMAQLMRRQDMFRVFCDIECPNEKALCNIVLDLCYKRKSTIAFAWSMCSDEIVDNLLTKSGGKIHFPVEDEAGDVAYKGKTFSFTEKEIGGLD